MKKKKALSCLFLIFIIALSLLQVTTQAAQALGEGGGIVVPGDLDGDKIVSESELADNILSYLNATYLGESVEYLELDKLREAVHIHRCHPRTVVDSVGRNITIYKPMERIVVFNSETIETMRSLKTADKIVGVGKYTIDDKILFQEFSNSTNVGSVWSPNYEEVLNCNPDAVFLYATCSPSYCEAIQNKLNELDSCIAVIRFDCFKPESYVKEVRELGCILEREKEAEDFIDFYEGWMNLIEEKVRDIPEDERPKIYFEAWRPYHTGGQGSGWHQKVEMGGGTNIFSELSGYPDVDPEGVIKRNPDVIIRDAKSEGGFDTDDVNELSDIRDEIMGRPGLAEITAVKDERVYIISNDILGGVRHFVGIGYMAKWFYPELFEDSDPKGIHQVYLTRFQHLDYNVYEHGVFVHPPLESYPRTIMDSANRIVTIDKPITRIIALNRNTIEMMRSLNLEKNRIVGISKDVSGREKFFPELKDCPNVGSAWSPDIEKILELEPDAVFLYATHFETSSDEVQKKLEGANITVIRFDCFKPENYIEEVKKLGYILEKEEQAAKFIEFYEGCLNSIEERVDGIPDDARPRVYFEGFERPYATGGKGTILHQIVEMAGGDNIFSELSGYKDVDPEEVIYCNPEIIVKQAYTRGKYGYNVNDTMGLRDIENEIMDRQGLEKVSAVENKKVYVIIKEITGGKHFLAMAYEAKWFYPDLFKDLDPDTIHQRYLTEFQGLDFDLDKHGVFVYPSDKIIE
ncbi:iron complex transport system substrate-binding protein [ANME-1 cluster archaeon GoMg1]|nr:iron complex transport system substrate-binding protein [ANME-1 cluster archaeon GoMg1]